MKVRAFIYLVFSILPFCVSSQEIPIIKVGEENIDVKKLYIQTEVVGDIAITTFDMQFYNSNNRVLEGELSFPLGENQSVTRFALEINDVLRDAVVVEKEKARVAYETTVRNKIDPALLEQTKGNNYKARIYPIPANGYKRVVLTFQQKLTIYNDAYYYKLPLNFKNKLEDFTFEIAVLNQKNKPVFQDGMLSGFEYDAKENMYSAKINKKEKRITKPVLIKIPLNLAKEKLITTDDYFYFTKQLTVEKRKVALEKRITIFWDASLSQKDKKIISELYLLNKYFNKVQTCKVNLVIFNTKIKSEETFIIKEGNWQSLKDRLENIIYDGASSFNFLSTYKNNSKANLLFTDGLNTLSDLELNFAKKTFIINSARSANHLDLKNIAYKSGGNYLNINESSLEKEFLKFTEEQLQFLGTNFSETDLEVYPKKGTTVTETFSISGKGNIADKVLQLKFGYGNKVVETVSFKLKKKSFNNRIVTKIWAQKKLEDLLKDKKENENEIVALSKKHQVISPFTSMLILDRVEDYVTHNITPPQELRKQYDALIAQKVYNRKDRFNRLQENLFSSYTRFFDWYAINFEERKKSSKNITKSHDSRVSGVNTSGSRTITPIEDEVIEIEEIEDVREEAPQPVNYPRNNNDTRELLDEIVVVGYGVRKNQVLQLQ